MKLLGAPVLYWCHECNLAVLDSRECPQCRGGTVRIDYNFDIRPAFQYDRDLLRRTVDGQYGEGVFERIVPDGRLILFGIEFGEDESYKVFCDGHILGKLIANCGRWAFAPGSRSASLMARAVTSHTVTVSSKGQSMAVRMHRVPGEEVREADPGIVKGDTVFVRNASGAIKSFGRAMADSEGLRDCNIAVKNTSPLASSQGVPDKYHTWEETVKLNNAQLDIMVKKSSDFVREIVSRHKGVPCTVSLSGGKDSLATLLVVMKAGVKPKIIYADTHMDYGSSPLVRSIAERYGLELISCGIPEDVLYRNIERLGPPSVDYRWCCKVHQLAQFQILGMMLGGMNLTFVGQRRYESTLRMRIGNEWVNPASPNQICASPIQDWNALHVWMFLTREDAPYNRLYEHGFDRIGCYWCPVPSVTHLSRIEWDDPVADRWKECIDRYGQDKGMPQVWHDRMLWRSRKYSGDVPGVDPELLKEIERKQRIVFYRTAVSDGIASSGREFDPSELIRLLPIVGREGHMEGGSLITGDLRVSPEGCVTFQNGGDKGLRESADDIFDLSLMATFCLECTVCVHQCKNSAITFHDSGIHLDASKCNGCRECMPVCPSIRILRPR